MDWDGLGCDWQVWEHRVIVIRILKFANRLVVT